MDRLGQGHPLRYWAVEGWGPVPAALRAPGGVFVELEDIDEIVRHIKANENRRQGVWCETKFCRGIIWNRFEIGRLDDADREDVVWVAVVHRRDDTTDENLTIPPEGSDCIVCSQESLSCLPRATGREYIEMTSGQFVVSNGVDLVARVGNAAVGKWFWELHPPDEETYVQFIIWHESVDDTDEYKSPSQDLNYVRQSWVRRSPPPTNSHTKLTIARTAALRVAEEFLSAADIEPLLKYAMAQLMSADPNGLWWVEDEKPDGFCDVGISSFAPSEKMMLFGQHMSVMVVGQLWFEKFCFVESFGPQGRDIAQARDTAQAFVGGCVVGVPCGILWRLQLKPHHSSGKIVAMRAAYV